MLIACAKIHIIHEFHDILSVVATQENWCNEMGIIKILNKKKVFPFSVKVITKCECLDGKRISLEVVSLLQFEWIQSEIFKFATPSIEHVEKSLNATKMKEKSDETKRSYFSRLLLFCSSSSFHSITKIVLSLFGSRDTIKTTKDG